MTSALSNYQRDYLQLRHLMGHALIGHASLISGFLADLDAGGHTAITVDAALRWACAPDDVTTRRRASRLAVIRGFATYVHSHDPYLAELIPDKLIPTRVVRALPYIYTPAQIEALMAAALTLRPALRGLTLSTIIGLMASTGMRISECLALNISDVDAGENVLTVTGKRGHRRLVPVHPSTLAAISDYLRARAALTTGTGTEALFLNSRGGRPHAGNVQSSFRGLTIGLDYHPRPGGKMPRLHDLRHVFATNTLIQACADGVDVDARIAILATYLGHVSPASTYWYYSATPELLALAAGRIAAAQRAVQRHEGQLS
jgi:integrase/recombinase XerD